MDNLLEELVRWRMFSGLGSLALLLAWESFVPFFSWFANKKGRERVWHGLKNLTLAPIRL